MFVRKKKNRSGSITVVVVDKCGTKFKEIHLGTTSKADEVEQLLLAGKKWIADYGGQRSLDLWSEERLLSHSEVIDYIASQE